jgi:hypothetical protein
LKGFEIGMGLFIRKCGSFEYFIDDMDAAIAASLQASQGGKLLLP